MQKINIPEKLSLFADYWNPRIAAELNGQHVKLVKFKGEFLWHKHEHEDELFYVLNGKFSMEFIDRIVELSEGDMLVVPKGIEHRPVANEEVAVMLFEPVSTVNTGNAGGELTRNNLEKI
jgi:mannose-6-phosphate isomerase-like protein (cupin superfamily)